MISPSSNKKEGRGNKQLKHDSKNTIFLTKRSNHNLFCLTFHISASYSESNMNKCYTAKQKMPEFGNTWTKFETGDETTNMHANC